VFVGFDKEGTGRVRCTCPGRQLDCSQKFWSYFRWAAGPVV